MDNNNRTIISRRSRPAKEPLSKETIVKMAFELLKNEGISGLTMRKVAKALDTGPSSLYVYVRNVQELNAYVLDYGLGHIVLPDVQKGSDQEQPWKHALFAALCAYQKTLFEWPGIAELALTTMPIGQHSLAITEYILKRLHEGGIPSTAAAWGVDLFLLYVSSSAFEHTVWNGKEEGSNFHTAQQSYQSVDASNIQ